MGHAWCTDVSRDAAVRAAEDGRAGPLPTLEQAIDGMFPKSVSASSAGEPENKGDGMRTDRVVLEITGAPGWRVNVTGRDVESVRVVSDDEREAEVAKLQARVAELEAAAKFAPSANADAVSNQPRGWLTPTQRLLLENAASTCRAEANSCYQIGDQHEAGVYALEAENIDEILASVTDTQPRGWLSAEEREAVETARDFFHDDNPVEPCDNFYISVARMMKQILARSTPPEVVLPELPFTPDSTHAMGWWEAIGKVKRALAAAGVTVKEET